MAQVNGDRRTGSNSDPSYVESEPQAPNISSPFAETETPVQALLPNLDRVSRSSFRRGTVSRHRINVAILVLVLVALGVTVLIVFADSLF
ncbi:hypothetical protein [Mycetocola sp.]|uniref:hypothetical protein n=1 Tax=Mycetocola sp. TaxID=1871042 RepID=UPI0039898217